MKFKFFFPVKIPPQGSSVEALAKHSQLIYNLLSKEEIKWIDDYHSQVRKHLLPFMNSKQSKWLKEETEKIIH